jgi:hypothetical protein
MGIVIFSLERQLSGGTKMTQDYANKIEKPMLHVYDTRKERLQELFSPIIHLTVVNSSLYWSPRLL